MPLFYGSWLRWFHRRALCFSEQLQRYPRHDYDEGEICE
jgi:hypothetical protein